jgi:hypothetical protein
MKLSCGSQGQSVKLAQVCRLCLKSLCLNAQRQTARRRVAAAEFTPAFQSPCQNLNSAWCFVRVSSCDFVDRLLYAANGTIHEITRTNTKRTN